MPLTGPGGGGAVDLIQELLLTVPSPNSLVQFTGLNINSDRAYTLEFEIIINGADAANYPTDCLPVTNQNVAESIRKDQNFYGQLRCEPFCDCNAPQTESIQASSTHYFGTFTWRRVNVVNRAVGYIRGAQWQTATFVSQGFGAFIFPQTVTNVTSVGVIFSKQPANGFDVGSVFRLYKGSG